MIELKPFQKEDVKEIYAFYGRALLALEMGLGKTIEALYWITKIPRHRPVVIVVPSSVKYTWQAEASMHFGLRTEVLEGRRPRGKHIPGNIVILNYDILPAWLPVLRKAKIKCLVFDEIHYIKNPTAQRTVAALALARGVPSILGLSGTPFTNRPIELWPVLSVICPDLFPDYEKYAWRYCKPRYTRYGWMYDGATRLPELRRKLLANCMIRRRKKDVLQDLPPKIHSILSIKLKSYVEYNQAEDDFLGWLKSQSAERARRAKKSAALTKVGYLLRLVAKLKLDYTTQWVEEFFELHPKKKLVIMTMHKFVIAHFVEKFGALKIDGSVTGRMRAETVRQFQSNKRHPLLIGNWKAAGVGITLTAAHNLLAHDFPWTPGDMMQGGDRVHRIGQKHQVVIHYPTVLRTIEEKLIKILRTKASVLDAILDGGTSIEDLDVYGALVAACKTERTKK